MNLSTTPDGPFNTIWKSTYMEIWTKMWYIVPTYVNQDAWLILRRPINILFAESMVADFANEK
jgi:hypothetical protein